MTKVKYSTAAKQDLEEIGDYIAQTLKNPIAALNTLRKIQDTVDKLTDFPLIGSALSSNAGMEKEYRYLVSRNYLVFYRVQTDSVYIARILYGRRDYMSILFGDVPENEPESTE